jgi:hypothetical protein
VKNGRVDGYVTLLSRDVYDAAQDEDESVGQRLKGRAIHVFGRVLRNRDGETLVGLVRSTFIEAILPGFERERRSVRR